MYSSIYNDKRIDTKKFFYENLINSNRFSSTIRATPNKYSKTFIGELNSRMEPKFGIYSKYNNKKSFNYKLNNSISKITKNKKLNLPKLLINNNMLNNLINNKKKKLLSNDGLNTDVSIGIVDLNFPYCKPILKNSNTNPYFNLKHKNKYLNNNNDKIIDFKKSKRLFHKSLANIHQIINKTKDCKYQTIYVFNKN